MAILGMIISVGLLVGYPIFGLKVPQRDNPFYFRKKYGSTTTIEQYQELAQLEYGNDDINLGDTGVALTQNGFQMVGNGLRMDLDNYKDLYC